MSIGLGHELVAVLLHPVGRGLAVVQVQELHLADHDVVRRGGPKAAVRGHELGGDGDLRRHAGIERCGRLQIGHHEIHQDQRRSLTETERAAEAGGGVVLVQVVRLAARHQMMPLSLRSAISPADMPRMPP